MIINLAYPLNGTQLKFEYKDEKKWNKLFDRKLGEEVEGDQFGDEDQFSGHLFQISGGCDKNGFTMK